MNTEKIKKSDYIESVDAGNKEIPTFKFYNYQTLARFGETELGIQEPGDSHETYKEKLKNGDKIKIVLPVGW